MNAEDVELVYVWENDPLLWEFSYAVSPYSHDDIRRIIDVAAPEKFDENGQLRFMIELVGTGEAVGAIDLTDHVEGVSRAAVGVLVYDEGHRGKGYAAEALKLLSEHAAERLKLHQLYAYMPSDNRASIALFTSAGFAECGLIKDWVRDPRGRWKDAVMMQLVFAVV